MAALTYDHWRAGSVDTYNLFTLITAHMYNRSKNLQLTIDNDFKRAQKN